MKSKRKAFTILELLIGMVIFTVLLAAIAVAMESSVNSYTTNEGIFRSLNIARQAITRITFELRNAQGISTTSPTNECSMITENGDDVTYRYDSSQGQLWLVTNDDLTDSDYLLCDNVTMLSFDKQIASKDGVDYVRYVKIVIEVSTNDIPQRIASAVVIRKNL